MSQYKLMPHMKEESVKSSSIKRGAKAKRKRNGISSNENQHQHHGEIIARSMRQRRSRKIYQPRIASGISYQRGGEINIISEAA